MNIKLTKEQIEWIAFGVMAVVVLLIVSITFFVRPALTQKKKLWKKYLEKSEELANNERMASRKKKFKQAVDSLIEDKAKINEIVPKTTGTFSILSILNSEAQKTGIVFDRIEPRIIPPGEAKQLEGYTIKDYLLDFKSGYHELGTFVNNLENISPYIHINDITITSRGGEQHQVRLIIRCLLQNTQ